MIHRRDPLHDALLDLEAGAPAGPPPALHRDRRPWIIAGGLFATAAVIAGFLIGIGVLDRSVGQATPSPTALLPSPTASATAIPTSSPSPAATEAPATPSPTQVPTASPDSSAWSMARVVEPSADTERGPVFFGVGWYDGPGWVAYGKQEIGDDGEPGLWTSQDGRTWVLAQVPSGLEGLGVIDLTEAQDSSPVRFVAVLSDSGRSEILVSENGTTWELAVTPGTETMVASVAHGPAGFVATGWITDFDTFDSEGRVWQSTDGLSWTESAPPELARALASRIETIDGRYVAAGFPDGSNPPLTTWTSTDGATWSAQSLVSYSGSGAGSCLCVAIDAQGNQIVILGMLDSPFATVSEDGVSWAVERISDGFAAVSGVDVLGDGTVIATGPREVIHGQSLTLIWVRNAGETSWQFVDWRDHLPDDDEQDVDSTRAIYVAAGPDRTLFLIADGVVLLTDGRVPQP